MRDDSSLPQAKAHADTAAWKEIVIKYQKPSSGRALWQIVNTLIPYATLWYLMYLSLAVSYWLVVPLAALAGAFLVRVFIIHHDCGHGSFFKSRKANDILGFITGVLTFTPYHHWRWEHALHHATAGDLDRRGTGDVWTLTVQEYLEASRWRRFAYRLARNPIVLFVLAPLFLFMVKHRFPNPNASRRDRLSVYWMNLAILGMAFPLSAVFGWKAYLLIQLMIMAIAGSAGVWLFYVQHQFDGVYWERGQDWDYTAAALQGSSFYKLPRILQWFSGNIGYHHIHHLSSRVPNYNLERCHKAHPLFQSVKPVTLFSSFKSFTFRLWDEQRRKLVGYHHLRGLRRQEKRVAQRPRRSGFHRAAFMRRAEAQFQNRKMKKMNTSKCPHCRQKLGNFMYAYECPHCHKELVHNRKLTVSATNAAPPRERAWPFKMFTRLVRLVET